MKKITLLIIAVLMILGCSSDDNSTENIPQPKYKSVQKRLNEGESPLSIYNSGIVIDSLYAKNYKGGLIYHLNITDGTGLLAHFQDNSSACNWGAFGDVKNANSTIIGSGYNNTVAIMEYYLDNNTAADMSNNLVISGYDDWYLPSKDEMNKMIQVLKNKDGVYFGAVTGYWTSSNIDINNVWIVKFDKTAMSFLKYSSGNTYDIRVRATRKF